MFLTKRKEKLIDCLPGFPTIYDYQRKWNISRAKINITFYYCINCTY